MRHLAGAGGVLVTGVSDDSPAERGGVRGGDIVIGVAGSVVTGIDDLQRLLTEERIGEPVGVVVLREGRQVTVGVIPIESSRAKT